MSLFSFSLYMTKAFLSASSRVSVQDELWPFTCLEVTTDSIQSETNFSPSKLSKYGPSILTRIRPLKLESSFRVNRRI